MNGKKYTLLDVGCGSGSLGRELVHALSNVTYTGIDLSQKMVGKAQKKLPDSLIVKGDAESLPFEDSSFDIVTCCISFHHYPHPLQAVSEMRRVCKHGGYIMLIDISPQKVTWISEMMNILQKIDGGVRCYSTGEFEEMFEKVGWQKVSCISISSYLFPIKLYEIHN